MGIITKCNFCGKKFEYTGGISHFKRNKNHYCSVKHIAKHGMAKKDNQDKEYKLWCGIKKRSMLKNIEFNLLPIDIPKIPIKCPILGIKLSKENNVVSDNSPSVDRINPNMGYVKGNIQIISNRANRIKSNATPQELIKIGNYLLNYEKNKN